MIFKTSSKCVLVSVLNNISHPDSGERRRDDTILEESGVAEHVEIDENGGRSMLLFG